MVLTRSPLRISLGGGGTDLPSYYRTHGGFLISAAIDKYVFVSVLRPFTHGIYLKYSRHEHVQRVEDVQHPIIRECLAMRDSGPTQIEITTVADIPAGTGLGSSGSFTTALLKALYAYDLVFLQDQYIAAFGGITCFTFSPDDRVEAVPLKISSETLLDLEDNLLLFFTGQHRSASSMLKDQDVRTKESDSEMIANLHTVKDLAVRSRRALEEGRCREFGEIMHEHWLNKKKRSEGISSSAIDEWYDLGRANGAVGGKVVGAGGGGFLLFYAEDRIRLRKAMAKAGLDEVRFRFPNIVTALQHAKQVGAKIVGIVGRDGGYTARVADACVLIPAVNPESITPHTESFHAVVWHLVVSHPRLKAMLTKWESSAKSPSAATT